MDIHTSSRLFVIASVFFLALMTLLIVGLVTSQALAQSQAESTISTYENPAIGLKFTYPSQWQLQNTPIGLTMTPDENSHFSLEVIHLSRLGIPNPTLKDYAQYGYRLCCGTMSTPISDNQTTIGKNHTAMQYEYTTEGFGIRQGLDVWAISNDVGYQFEYISDQGSAFSKNIPEIRKLLDSVEFTPIVEEEPELPSFMQ